MPKSGISEKVKQFIFQQIDSVEQLEVLLFIRSHQDKVWTRDQLAQEMRSSSNSVSTRLDSLERLGLIERDSQDSSLCRYKLMEQDAEDVLHELAEHYKVKKQKILELIFSPLKKGRHFANAFKVNQGDGGAGEDDNG